MMQKKILITSRQITLEAWAIAIAGVLLFTLGLWHQEFTGFETRFAVFAKEMLRLGVSIFPKTYGEPYPDYPATSTLLIWLTSRPFGEVNKFTAIFPTALASAASLALTYRLLSQVSRQWAFMAVCLELLTITFLAEARAISLDQMLTTIALGCFMLVYREKNALPSPTTWVWILILLATGFSIRGPMGIVIPVGIICSYYVVTQQWRVMLGVGIAALVLLIACWFVLLFLARLEGGESFVADVVRMQVTGRLSGSEVVPPPYYYLVNGMANFALAFPFALIALLVIIKKAAPQLRIPALKKSSQQEWNAVLRMAVLMAAWFVVILIGLSIPEARKSRYLLPAVPAMAALAAYVFIARDSKILVACYQVLRMLLLFLPLLLASVTVYASHYVVQHHLSVGFHSYLLLFLLVACQFIQWHCAFFSKASFESRDRIIAAVAVLAFWSTNVLLREPVETQLHMARPFVQAVEALRQQKPAPLVMYGIGKDSIDIVYHVNVEGEFKAQFIDKPQQFMTLSYPVYLLVSSKNSGILQSNSVSPLRVEWPQPVYEGTFRENGYRVYYLESSPLHS